MAGETVLRSEIESNVARYLDRVGDPAITAVTGLWFSQAHRKAQRLFNFSFMEGTDTVTPLVEGSTSYNCSPLMKEVMYGSLVELGVDLVLHELIQYRKTDVETIRRYMAGGYSEAVFTHFGRTYTLWPPTTQVDPTKTFVVYGYMFQPTPAVDGSDWLTNFGSDYLMYQSLLESVDYVSAPEGRLIAWNARATETFSELIGMDTQFKISGPVGVR